MLFDNIIDIFLISVINTLYVYLVYASVKHTYGVHTILLCSIATTFISTWKIARKTAYTSMEYIGIGINVFGAYLCCCEGSYEPRID